MASVVNVNITGSDELSATMTRAEQNMARFGATVNSQASQATGAFFRLEGAAARTGVSMRNIGSAVGIVTSQIGVLGPAANLAGNAIVAMATAVGPLSLAFGALAVTMGLFISRIEKAREELRNLAEIELRGLQREIEGLTIDQDIRQQLRALESVDPVVERIRQKFERMRIEAGKAGLIVNQEVEETVRNSTAARIKLAEEATINEELTKRREESSKKAIEAAKREKDAIDQARKSLNDQADALNGQLIALELGAEAADQFKINNLLASDALKNLALRV